YLCRARRSLRQAARARISRKASRPEAFRIARRAHRADRERRRAGPQHTRSSKARMTRFRVMTFAAPEDSGGERLDAWLAGQSGAPTRSQIKVAADDQRLRVDGSPVRASYRLRGGESVELSIPEHDPSATAVTGEAIDLDVLYEDEEMLAINKPAGMVVHPAAGNRSGTLVHALLYRDPSIAWPGQPERAGIVHRLDRDTSGVILVAKNVAALEALSRQFRERS